VADTPHAVPVSTIAPTGIKPGSDSNSRTDQANTARPREGLAMRTPSIVPHDADRDTYLVLDDFRVDLVVLGARLTPKALIARR
jgi:hypothetical protein